MESIQYNACLAITGAIRCTSREKIYQELDLESLQLCRCYKKLCLFYKAFKNEHPKYLFHFISVRCTPYATRNESNIPLIEHNFFKNYFFASVIIEWNNLNPNLRNSKSNSVFKLVTRLRLGLSHLRKHKFKHSFQDTINPLCNCGQDIESATHFFLHCTFFIDERSTFLGLDSKLLDCTDYDLRQTHVLATHPKLQAIISKSLSHRLIISYRVRDLTNPFLNKLFHQYIGIRLTIFFCTVNNFLFYIYIYYCY